VRTRPYDERDRAKALEFLKDARAIDSPSHHIQVDEDGRGLGLWIKPDAGDECILGPIILSPESVGNRSLFYQLIAACIQEAVDLGFKLGYAPSLDAAMVTLLRQENFDITFVEGGWDPNTGTAVLWEAHVDLPTVLAQLQGVLDG
jgi:hypothetical protein